MANIPPQGFPDLLSPLSPVQIPQSQLPPGYGQPSHAPSGQYSNRPQPTQQPFPAPTESPQHGTSHFNNIPPGMTPPAYSNNLGPHSSNNSPAFNKSAMTQQPINYQTSPHRPPTQQHNENKLPPNMVPPMSYASTATPAPSLRPSVSNSGAIPSSSSNFNQFPSSSAGPLNRPPVQNQYTGLTGGPPPHSQSQPVRQINPNMPPLIPSSQPLQTYSSMPQPIVNGPSPIHTPAPGAPHNGARQNNMPPLTSQPYRQPMNSGPPGSVFSGPPTSRPMGGLQSGPPMAAPSTGFTGGTPSAPMGRLSSGLVNGPPGTINGPPSISMNGPPSGPMSGPPSGSIGGPPSGPMSGPPSGPMSGPPTGPMSGLPSGPMSGLPSGPMSGPPSGPMGRPPSGPIGPMNGPPSGPVGPMNGPPSGHMTGPPSGPLGGLSSGPTSGPPQNMYQAPGSSQSPMNNRYPPNVPPQPNYNHQVPPLQPQQGQYQGNQYNGPQNLTNQMGQMNITKAGFGQMWGQQMFDLLQTKHILPEYPEDPPEVRLGHQFAEAGNCSPELFRCTINRIPDTNNLLQKSRLPLGILIHPFKDLNHLPVIQCTSIVRCRACRTYINPFVYFVDSKRWKCNLCYRVNDLPEEFQYDPVSKSYGDPTRRPEIKSATIEFIAPGEYMLRPPQPAVYLFLLDISQIARESGYLQVFCDTLKKNMEQLPGDARTQVGFICYDTNVHFYLMGDGLTRPREMTVIDIDDIFLPSPESLLVNLSERREMVMDLLDVLPKRHSAQGVPASALGSALQAAYKLMSPTGGRITVMQTCLPNVGPGAVTSREDPNARSSKEVAHLNPANDFYKRLALDCSGAQIAVDLFLINSQYSDLATLSGVSKFSGGSVYHIPLFKSSRAWQADQLRRMLTRYLTRKIGFEAVMRVRCTRGIAIHTFHGNFFVRSTDLLSLPNVSPDSGFGMQLTIEESLSDLQQVCFQAALLYTSSKGERRIRVHTLCLPVANNLTDVLHSADQQCIIGLLTKMAVDRCQQSSLSDAREALINVAVDTLSAHRLAQNLPSGASSSLHAPSCLRLLPLYLSGLLKHPAFRTGVCTRLDDRVAAMCQMKSLPLIQLMRSVYPDLYPVHNLGDYLPQQPPQHEDDDVFPDPPRLHLSAERINSTGAYLLDDGETMILFIGHAVNPAYIQETFGAQSYQELPDEARELPLLETPGNALLHAFVEKLNDDRPYAANISILRDNSPVRQLFTERLVDDRMESAFSYYEFLQHIKSLMK